MTVAIGTEERWLNAQTRTLIAAIRADESEHVYATARETAARTLAAPRVLRIAGGYAAARGDFSEAVRFATLQRAAAPRDRGPGIVLARLLAKGGHHAIARSVVARLLEDAPGAADLMRLHLEVALGDRDGPALADEVAAMMASPAATRAAYFENIAATLSDARHFELADAVIAEGAARFGEGVGLMRLRANLAYRRGAFEEADELWTRLSGEPGLARTALIYRARIALGRDDRIAAESLYEAVLHHEPANVEAIRYVVRGQIRRSAFVQAEASLATWRAVVGEDATAMWLDATLLTARGDLAGAVALSERALKMFPADAALALRIADLHSDTGDWLAASKVIDAGLKATPDDFSLLGRKIRAAEQLRADTATTLQVIDRALALRPMDEGMLRSRANLLGRLGDRHGAIETAVAALDHHPRQVAFWRIAIANSLNLSERAAALALVDRARGVFTADTHVDRLALVEVLEVAELTEEAAAAAHAAVAAAPDDPAARTLAARIAIALGCYRDAQVDLVALQDLTTRPGPEAMLRARVAAAIAYVDASPLAGVTDAVFPDAILARIAAAAARMAWQDAAAVVVHVTAGMGAGGAERQLALTVRGQAARAAEGAMRPVLIASDLNPLSARDFFLPEVMEAGVEVVDLAERRANGAPRDLMAADLAHRANIGILAALPPEMASLAVPLYGELVRLRPRVCHLWQDTTAIAGAMAAALAGVPRIVIGTRSTRPVERQRVRPWLAAGYQALIDRPGTLILNNSRNGARDYEGWLGRHPGTVEPVYNGYDFAAMRSRADPAQTQDIRAGLGAASGDPVFGGVMRLSFEKRPELWTGAAIALARRIPNLRGVLIGDGPMRAQIQTMIDEAGLADRIILAGRQIPVEPWMKAMSLLFLSSLTEGLPNVLIEVQALGLPVASMRVGGAPETISDGETGILIDEGTPEEIAARIAPLMLDAALRAQYGGAAFRWTEERFSDHAMLDRLMELYTAGNESMVSAAPLVSRGDQRC